MCLAIPARIVEMTGDTATVDMEGVRRNVSTMLLPDAAKRPAALPVRRAETGLLMRIR